MRELMNIVHRMNDTLQEPIKVIILHHRQVDIDIRRALRERDLTQQFLLHPNKSPLE